MNPITISQSSSEDSSTMEHSVKKTHFVRNCYLFAGLNEDELQGVDRITSFRTYKKNDLVFQEGEKADGFFLLCQGRVKKYKLSIEGKEQKRIPGTAEKTS